MVKTLTNVDIKREDEEGDEFLQRDNSDKDKQAGINLVNNYKNLHNHSYRHQTGDIVPSEKRLDLKNKSPTRSNAAFIRILFFFFSFGCCKFFNSCSLQKLVVKHRRTQWVVTRKLLDVTDLRTSWRMRHLIKKALGFVN